ncbi:hypothetical protein L2E82_02120 [Cichorium intybus]|uniref:Uncharacterized protein n=1 Tax=Cichorium intybus TaxID=13427 RepID=A0ACB9H2X8_CICIN|nr:hypothetical protein L2E82_02120 [Cichorium intybus]
MPKATVPPQTNDVVTVDPIPHRPRRFPSQPSKTKTTLSGGEDEDDSLVCRRRDFKIQYAVVLLHHYRLSPPSF